MKSKRVTRVTKVTWNTKHQVKRVPKETLFCGCQHICDECLCHERDVRLAAWIGREMNYELNLLLKVSEDLYDEIVEELAGENK